MIFYRHYKKIRRERKISLEDISKRTKIDLKYLKFLESGKFAEIPGIYTKLFFKAYINEIGCDTEEAIENLESFLNKKNNINIYKENTSKRNNSVFKIRFSHFQRSNILVGAIFLSLVFATILFQNKPSSSIKEKQKSLRVTHSKLSELYTENSNDTFLKDLTVPVTIRFELENKNSENYISFSRDNVIYDEHFIYENHERTIEEEWSGENFQDIIIANTRDIKFQIYKTGFGKNIDLSYDINNDFPVLINLTYDPFIVSITKYIPKRKR